MHKRILNYLSEIEKEYDIAILWACESGSRAWGFASDDSDYDIRFIYVHRIDWYLRLTSEKDSIEMMLEDNNIDISGWELRKALNLMKKSNSSVIEWIQSPIVYVRDEGFIEEFRQLTQSFYSKMATMNHYLSMAKKFVTALDESSSYSLKKFFYALRATLACQWIMEKDKMPPTEFEMIYKNIELDSELSQSIDALIKLKSEINENYLHSGEKHLTHYMRYKLKEANEIRERLPSAQGDLNSAHALLTKYIRKHDH